MRGKQPEDMTDAEIESTLNTFFDKSEEHKRWLVKKGYVMDQHQTEKMRKVFNEYIKRNLTCKSCGFHNPDYYGCVLEGRCFNCGKML